MKNKYNELKKWFDEYTAEFSMEDKKDQENINLKINHSIRVEKEMEKIIEDFKLSNDEKYLAKIIALFHDIGRFEQYKKYSTFSDYKSLDHGELGVKVIKKNNLSNDIDKDYQNIIYKAIREHNKPGLNKDYFINDQEIFYARVIRDADKLDILNIFVERYKNDNENNYLINLASGPEINDEIYNQILNKKNVGYDELKTVNDLKLLQLSWVYNINFNKTFEIIEERKYVQSIYNSMEKNKKADKIYSQVREFIKSKI